MSAEIPPPDSASTPMGGPAERSLKPIDLILKNLLLAFLFFVTGKLAFYFALSFGLVGSSIFFPAGIGFAFVLLYGWRLCPGIFVGEFLLSFNPEISIYTPLILSIGNTLAALAGWFLLRRLEFDKRIVTLRDYLLLTFTSVFLIEPVSASFGICGLWYSGLVVAENFPVAFKYWWLANIMGQLLLTAPILAWVSGAHRVPLKKGDLRDLISSVVFGVVYFAIFAAYGKSSVLREMNVFLIVFPVIIALSLKFHFRGAALSTLFVATMTQVLTAEGLGPFDIEEKLERLVYLNTFIIGGAFSAGLVGVMSFERKRTELKLREAIEEIRTLRGILPICSSCKKIQNDEGSWDRIEVYVEQNADVQFSHGLCEACAETLYGGEDWYEKKRPVSAEKPPQT